MISEPYSTLRLTSSGASGSARVVRKSSQPPICDSQRRGYSSSGTLKRSIRSSRPALMKYGTYSEKCSLLSVTKYPSRRSIS